MFDERREFVSQPKPFLTGVVAAVTGEPPMQVGFFFPRARKNDNDFEPMRAGGLEVDPTLLNVPCPSDLRALAGSHHIDQTARLRRWQGNPHGLKCNRGRSATPPRGARAPFAE